MPVSSVTGKYSVRVAINDWLKNNVPPSSPQADFKYVFTNRLTTKPDLPLVSVQEFVDFTPVSGAWGEILAAPGALPLGNTQGQKNQLRLDISIWTKNLAAQKNDLAKAYQLRDKLRYALVNSGKSDDNDVLLFPPIKILNGLSDTGVVVRVPIEEDNHILEQYFAPNSETPDLHHYRMLVKFVWFELI